ncbi:hypothetical protein HN51_037151 [Arachis hypogaea]
MKCLMVVGSSIRHAIQVLNSEASLPTLPSKLPVQTYLDDFTVHSSSSSLIAPSSIIYKFFFVLVMFISFFLLHMFPLPFVDTINGICLLL